MDDKITIEHEQWGRVEGARREGVVGCVWEKDGALYFDTRGWREVPKPKWVPVAVLCSEREVTFFDGTDIRLIVPYGYRWKTVEIEKEAQG